jgi:hypothetical protein
MATVAALILLGGAVTACVLWLVGRWYVAALVRLGRASKTVRIAGGALLWLSFGALCVFPLFLALTYPPIRHAVDHSWVMMVWLAVCYVGAFLPAGHHIFVRRIHELRSAGFFLPEA